LISKLAFQNLNSFLKFLYILAFAGMTDPAKVVININPELMQKILLTEKLAIV
jgi:hypothetical protein